MTAVGYLDDGLAADLAAEVSARTAADALLVAKSKSWLNVTDPDYGVVGNGTTDITSLFNSALQVANTFGLTTYVPVPAVHYKITGPLTPYAGQEIVGAGKETCEIRQYTRTNKPVFDCLNVDGVTIHGFKLVLNGGPLTSVGSVFRAENGYTYCTGVWTNGSRNTIYDIKSQDFATAVTLSAWDGVSAQSTTNRTGNVVRDIEIAGANFGILFLSQEALRIKGIYCHDNVDSSSGANPLHAVYGTGNVALRSKDVSLSGCITRGISFGAAYQIKYTDGLSMSNMIADDCQGIFNGIDIFDASFTGLESRGDTSGTSASFAIQKVSTQPARITIDGLSVTKTADAVGTDRCISVIADDVSAANLNLFPNCNATSSNYVAYFRGARISVPNPKITNLGSGTIRGVLVGAGASFPTSDVSITNPEMNNVSALVDFETTVTGTNVVSYNPGLQRSIAATTSYFNSINGTASFSISRQPWTRTTTVSGAGTYTPVPALETVTRLDVTSTAAFTIGAPAGVAKTGMTQEIVIVNSAGAALGTITWNAAYALRTTLVAPPDGESHSITFAYNGTTWREIYRSHGAVLDINPALTALAADALTAGEVIPRRTDMLSNTIGVATGVVYLTYFTADKTEAINNLTVASGNIAAGATPTLCKLGIYSVDGSGNVTLVASTASDTSLFAGTSTTYTRALTSTFNKVTGQRYATAVLVVTSATAPTFQGRQLTSTNFMNTLSLLSPAVMGRITGQTDLPASTAVGSIVGAQVQITMQLS